MGTSWRLEGACVGWQAAHDKIKWFSSRFEKAGYSSEIGYVVRCAIGIGTENQLIPAIPATG